MRILTGCTSGVCARADAARRAARPARLLKRMARIMRAGPGFPPTESEDVGQARRVGRLDVLDAVQFLPDGKLRRRARDETAHDVYGDARREVQAVPAGVGLDEAKGVDLVALRVEIVDLEHGVEPVRQLAVVVDVGLDVVAVLVAELVAPRSGVHRRGVEGRVLVDEIEAREPAREIR